MTGRYSVVVYDRAGEYCRSQVVHERLADARSTAALFQSTYPKKTVIIHDYERDGRAVDDDEEESR